MIQTNIRFMRLRTILLQRCCHWKSHFIYVTLTIEPMLLGCRERFI